MPPVSSGTKPVATIETIDTITNIGKLVGELVITFDRRLLERNRRLVLLSQQGNESASRLVATGAKPKEARPSKNPNIF